MDVELALKSAEYKTYINAICQLEKVSVAALSETKRVAFFLNAYQCMYVHHFFKMVTEGNKKKETGYLSQLKQLISRG